LRPFVGASELVVCLVCFGYGVAIGGWHWWLAAAALALAGTLNLVEHHRGKRHGLERSEDARPVAGVADAV
jgi:hypothetical protein